MGRRRTHLSGHGMFLVTNRGTAQTMLYRSDHDRRCFMGLLGCLEARFGVAILAYVLMGNHYHLVVRAEGSLAEAMRFLDGEHARRFNVHHGRQGALFQGRYDARLLDTEAGLAGAGHYVHLNPLRAGLVAEPTAYRWSSLADHAAGRSALRWLRLELLAGATGTEYLHSLWGANPEFSAGAAAADDDEVFRAWHDRLATEQVLAASDALVADRLGVSADEFYIVAQGRTSVPRMVAVVHALRTCRLSAAVVASRYGFRNRTNVYAVVSRLRRAAVADQRLSAVLDDLGLGA